MEKIITPAEARELRQKSEMYLQSLRRVANFAIKERAMMGFNDATLFYRHGDPLNLIATELINLGYECEIDENVYHITVKFH